ncbi:MAG TPA: ZIP family metal transporter [Candidatus Levybacteria bacterium]|nr:ZIP family metal transporter [Candidatus Levybacteria bacterium]
MSVIEYIFLFTFLSSILSLIGGIVLMLWQKFAIRISHFLSAFAAGTLLGAAFLDLIPEAAEHAYEAGIEGEIFIWILVGILFFFFLERFIRWFHQHEHPHKSKSDTHTIPLIILGDSMHNFIDGVVIAATFTISIPLGIVTAIAVAAHEIPQEIGDFGVLLKKGMSASKAIILNVASALSSLLGATLFLLIGSNIENSVPYLLAITAGFFIYIALSDLVPEIQDQGHRKLAAIEITCMLLGIVLILIVTNLILGHGH